MNPNEVPQDQIHHIAAQLTAASYSSGQEKPASANEAWRTFRVSLNLLKSGSPQPG